MRLSRWHEILVAVVKGQLNLTTVRDVYNLNVRVWLNGKTDVDALL